MKKEIIAILTLLLCQGCIQLGSDTQPTRYYLLEPLAEPVVATGSEPLNIKLGPIEFPGYLDRLQIITRGADNAIITAPLDRWAEPLSENFQRTLQENLHRRLGNAEIQLAPWNLNSKPGYQILLTINRFDATLGKQLNVDIRWDIISLSTNGKKTRGHFLSQTEIGKNYGEMVKQLSSALANFSHELAANL
ncbi:ABC-type transport auxiliary lipoprotein component [Malonomonas rubra DSM 5091]|uniref:ABC-type transport auxiliary lipoprotein component n=1 Tax=Malonomonas rubra DSM 5091 TaxID=1122189 RepID=A0A1M6LFE9_MALRU|nr:PqiC family protein [Malonomonas rubra]SHJ69940.1 ABC-type transport auxiliary lipoprotein component [Malonomonas rubra DSM 5091]